MFAVATLHKHSHVEVSLRAHPHYRTYPIGHFNESRRKYCHFISFSLCGRAIVNVSIVVAVRMPWLMRHQSPIFVRLYVIANTLTTTWAIITSYTVKKEWNWRKVHVEKKWIIESSNIRPTELSKKASTNHCNPVRYDHFWLILFSMCVYKWVYFDYCICVYEIGAIPTEYPSTTTPISGHTQKVERNTPTKYKKITASH